MRRTGHYSFVQCFQQDEDALVPSLKRKRDAKPVEISVATGMLLNKQTCVVVTDEMPDVNVNTKAVMGYSKFMTVPSLIKDKVSGGEKVIPGVHVVYHVEGPVIRPVYLAAVWPAGKKSSNALDALALPARSQHGKGSSKASTVNRAKRPKLFERQVLFRANPKVFEAAKAVL